MYRVRQEELPFVGSSFQFIGADRGDVNDLRLPAQRPSGTRSRAASSSVRRSAVRAGGPGLWTVNGVEFEAGAGDILVIKAGEIHGFKCIGDAPLVQVDIHLSPRFIQENLE